MAYKWYIHLELLFKCNAFVVTMVARAKQREVTEDSGKDGDLVKSNFMKLLCLTLAMSKQNVRCCRHVFHFEVTVITMV